jgi:predicted small lipoprotein YifL
MVWGFPIHFPIGLHAPAGLSPRLRLRAMRGLPSILMRTCGTAMKRILALFAISLLLAACGNRGDLVLPSDLPPAQPAPQADPPASND